MEAIAQQLDRLIDTLNRDAIPIWITVVGIFVPILLSILLLWQSYGQNRKNIQLQIRMDRNSEKLKKELSVYGERVQMRGNILKIYDDFRLAQTAVGDAGKKIHLIFSNFSQYNGVPAPMRWLNELNDTAGVLCQAVNRAKLLLPAADTGIKGALENIYEKYKEIQTKANAYFFSGRAYCVYEAAWDAVGSAHGIEKNNGSALVGNPAAHDEFLRLCVSDATEELERRIDELLSLFEHDKFDKYFEPYLQMGGMDAAPSSPGEGEGAASR